MKRLVGFILCLACSCVFGGDLAAEFESLGQLMIVSLPSAPFPHPERNSGHHYKTRFFPASPHYSNSNVAIFVPKGFHAGRSTDFVVHFHGWDSDVTNVFRFYKLAEQLVESRRNAILVVPQGPFHAADSFGGKLEDVDGFKRFMDDVTSTLRDRAVVKSDRIGKIILSGHSGGYHVMSSIVEQGGLNSKIKELWLFDALYGQTPKFVNWLNESHGKIVDIYTTNGGTKSESENLMADLKKRKVRFVGKLESELSPKDLKKNQLVFIYTDLKHNDVVHVHETFKSFLMASCLGEVSRK